MHTLKSYLITMAVAAAALEHVRAVGGLGPNPGSIKNLVTFGDSYTDVVSSHTFLAYPNRRLTYSCIARFPQAITAVLGQSMPLASMGTSISSPSLDPARHALTTLPFGPSLRSSRVSSLCISNSRRMGQYSCILPRLSIRSGLVRMMLV